MEMSSINNTELCALFAYWMVNREYTEFTFTRLLPFVLSSGCVCIVKIVPSLKYEYAHNSNKVSKLHLLTECSQYTYFVLLCGVWSVRNIENSRTTLSLSTDHCYRLISVNDNDFKCFSFKTSISACNLFNWNILRVRMPRFLAIVVQSE